MRFSRNSGFLSGGAGKYVGSTASSLQTETAPFAL